MENKWWDKISLSTAYEDHVGSWFFRSFFQYACNNNKTLYKSFQDGYIKDIEPIVRQLKDKNLHLLIKEKTDDGSYTVFVNENLLVVLDERRGKNRYWVNSQSIDKAAIDDISALFNKYLSQESDSGQVKMLLSCGEGIDLVDIGNISAPFVKDNYPEEVSIKYDKMLQELTSKNPIGRLFILEGKPGTGKSYMIRALISDIKKAWHVFIPSSMVEGLSEPGLMGVIMSAFGNMQDDKKLPIIMIVEDADSSIEKRNGSNLNRLSTLLNLADGLLGELADIRVIATTNADIKEIDEALTRPGRLGEKIHFPPLKRDHAKEVYKRLTGKEMSAKDPEYTLAEIYRLVRDENWEDHEKKNKESVGQYV